MVTGIGTTGFMVGIILIVIKTAGKWEDTDSSRINIMVLDGNTYIKCRYITSDDYFCLLLTV